MKKPTDERVAELVGLTIMVRQIVDQYASSPGVALSVYYTLFVGELVEIAAIEGNFEPIMEQLKRDAARWNAMLQAKNAEELYEIAKFTADYVTGEPHSAETH